LSIGVCDVPAPKTMLTMAVDPCLQVEGGGGDGSTFA
jgi:hypothetical protein